MMADSVCLAVSVSLYFRAKRVFMKRSSRLRDSLRMPFMDASISLVVILVYLL